MHQRKVLLIAKVETVLDSLDEFNEHWKINNLPYWEENGAKHIGSYITHLGGPENMVIRLFEFENYTKYSQFMELRENMFNSEQGRESLKKLYKYFNKIEESVHISVY